MAAADRGSRAIAFLSLSHLLFFFFFYPFTLLFWHFRLCSPVAFVTEWSPSKHLLPLNTYLSYNVIITEAKSSLIEYSSPHQNDRHPNIPLFYNLICGFISMNRVYRENPDNKELSKTHCWWSQVEGARSQPFPLVGNMFLCHLHVRTLKLTLIKDCVSSNTCKGLLVNILPFLLWNNNNNNKTSNYIPTDNQLWINMDEQFEHRLL